MPNYTFTLGKRTAQGPTGAKITVPSVESVSVISKGSVADGRVQDLRTITRLTEQRPPLDLSNFETLLGTATLKSVEDSGATKTIRTQESYFSDLWSSLAEDNGIQLGFYFDKRRFLKDNAAFPVLLNTPESADEFGVTTITLVRRTMHNTKRIPSSDVSPVLSYAPNTDDVFLPGNLVEDERLSNNGLIFYTAGELGEDLSGVSGKVQYGIEISMIDRTPDTMINTYKELFGHANLLRALYSKIVDSNRIEEYNQKLRRFNKSMSELDNDGLGGEISTTLTNAATALSNTLTLLAAQNSDVVDYSATVTAYGDSINNSRNPRGILEMSERLDILGTQVLNEVKKVFPGIGPAGDIGRSTGGTNMQASDVRPILYRHYFNDIIDRSEKEGFGYYYMKTDVSRDNPNSFREVSKVKYDKRAVSESNKYFNVEAIEGIRKEGIRSLLDPRLSSYAYFTPIGMKHPNLLGEAAPQSNNLNLTTKGRKYYESRAKAMALLLDHKKVSINQGSKKSTMALPWVAEPTSDQKFSSIVEQLVKETGCLVNYVAPNNREVNPMSRSALTDFFGVELQPNLTQAERVALEDQQREAQIELLQPERPPKMSSKLMMTLASGMTLEGKKERSAKYMDKTFNSLSLDIGDEEMELLLEKPYLIPPSIKAIIGNGLISEDPEDTISSALRLQGGRENSEEVERPPKSGYVFVSNSQGVKVKSADPFKNASKFAAMWLDYRQTVQVEFLARFGVNPRQEKDIGQPNWEQITQYTFANNQNKTLLCRLRPFSHEVTEGLFGTKEMELFELPIYNEYFMLHIGDVDQADFNLEEPEPEPQGLVVEAQVEPESIPDFGGFGT